MCDVAFTLLSSPKYDASESICKPFGNDLLFIDRLDDLSLRLPKTRINKNFSDIHEDKLFSNLLLRQSSTS